MDALHLNRPPNRVKVFVALTVHVNIKLLLVTVTRNDRKRRSVRVELENVAVEMDRVEAVDPAAERRMSECAGQMRTV